jgi:hypothetical protein
MAKEIRKMDGQVMEEEQTFPWTQPDVLALHKLFDQEFAQTKSPEEGEALFHRFFASAGLVEEKLREWQGKDVECNDVMTVAFELFAFKCFVFTCFFFNEYPEEMVKEWWQHPGMRSWANEQAFLEAPVKKIKEKFDKEASACQTMLDIQALEERYLSPLGSIAQEFGTFSALDQKKQVAIGAELFSLKSYIDYALFAIEFSSKAAMWTVPAVRTLQYQFERDLEAGSSEEDFRALEKRYIGEDGVIATQIMQLKRKRGATQSKHAEELVRLREALQSFFSSHTSEET